MCRMGVFLGKFIIDTVKSLRGILVAVITAMIIAGILLCFGYKADTKASIFKTLEHFVVFRKVSTPPKIHLLSQYPYEYKITDPRGWIDNNEILKISKEDKPLWLGIHNEEARSLHNVKFILFPPEGLIVVNTEEIKRFWMMSQFDQEGRTRYQVINPVNINPGIGWVIPIPIEFKFPEAGKYEFKFVVSSNEYKPYIGTFFIERVITDLGSP